MAILACMLWSTAFVGIKIGLPYTSPLQFAGIRFFLSGLMILPFAGNPLTNLGIIRNNLKAVLLVALLNTIIQYTLFYLGINLVPAALAAILIGSGPLFIAITSHFMMPDDRINVTRFFIFLLGIAGIVLVSAGRNSFTTVQEVGMLGVVLLVLVNISSGIGNIVVARDARAVPPLVLSSTSMILGGGSLFLVSLPVEGYQGQPKPAEYYLSLVWLSFLSAAAFSIWFSLLKRPGVKVSDLNFWKFLIPVVGAVLAWVILPEEKPSLVAVSGMGIIALSLILLNIYKRRADKQRRREAGSTA